jgi:hypothetical protein
VFGKKITVQFHQQSSKAKIRSKFAKICMAFAKHHLPKKVLNLACVKNLQANVDEGSISPISYEQLFHACLNGKLYIFKLQNFVNKWGHKKETMH